MILKKCNKILTSVTYVWFTISAREVFRNYRRAIYSVLIICILLTNCKSTDSTISNRVLNRSCVDIFNAIHNGSLAEVEAALADGSSANCTEHENNGESVLGYAVERSQIEIVNLLLKRGANPNYVSASRPILHQAIRNGNLNIVQALISSGASTQRILDQTYKTAIDIAIETDNAEILKYLVTIDPNINYAEDDGTRETYLMKAARRGKPELVKILIAAGANPNSQIYVDGKPTGYTALMFASINGHADLIRVLLNAKAKVDIQTWEGETALMLASKHNHFEAIRALLDAKAKVNAKNSDGDTALDFAATNDLPEVMSLLKKRGAKHGAGTLAKAYRDSENSKIAGAIAIDSQFCSQWANKMPAAATPRHSGDIDRACSNAWPRGSSDFAKCVQTWKDCAKFY